MSQALITREGLRRQNAQGHTEVSCEAHENSQKYQRMTWKAMWGVVREKYSMLYLNCFKIKGTDQRCDSNIQHVTTGILFAYNKNETILIFIFNKIGAERIKMKFSKIYRTYNLSKTIKNE